MKEVALEPMSIGRILDYSFRIYKQNFVKFIAIVSVVVVPVHLLLMVSQKFVYGPAMHESKVEAADVATDETVPAEDEEYIYDDTGADNSVAMILGSVGTSIAIFFSILANKLSQGALTHSISNYYLGTDTAIGEAYRYVGKRIFKLLGASILAGLIMCAGFLFFIVPGVIFGLWFAIVVPVIITEDCGIRQALSRSKMLVKGNINKVFLLGLMIVIINFLIQMPFKFVAQMGTFLLMHINASLAMLAVQFSEMVGQIIAAPIAAAAYILLYYDLRIRKEAFDLEILADKVQENSVAATA